MSGSRSITLVLGVRDVDLVVRQLEQMGDVGQRVLTRLNAAANAAAAQANGMGSAFRNSGSAMQNFGYQLTDLTGQLQAGTSAFVAISQQGGQFLQQFGAGGAIAAVGLTLASVAAQMWTAADNTKRLTDRTKELADAEKARIDAIRGAEQLMMNEVQRTRDLARERRNAAAAALEEAATRMQSANSDVFLRQLRAQEGTADPTASITDPLGNVIPGSMVRRVDPAALEIANANVANVMRQIEDLRRRANELRFDTGTGPGGAYNPGDIPSGQRLMEELDEELRIREEHRRRLERIENNYNEREITLEQRQRAERLSREKMDDELEAKRRRDQREASREDRERDAADRRADAAQRRQDAETDREMRRGELIMRARVRDELRGTPADPEVRRAAERAEDARFRQQERDRVQRMRTEERELERMSERWGDNIGDEVARGLFEGTRDGETAFQRLAVVFRASLQSGIGQALSATVFTPLASSVFSGLGFGGAGGGSAATAGGGLFGSLASSVGTSMAGRWIGDAMPSFASLTGAGLYGSAGTFGSSAAALGGGMNSGAALSGYYGASSSGGLWGTSSSTMLGAGATWLGAGAAGYAVGQGLNSLARGNVENSNWGSAAGAAIGAVIAGPIGLAVGAALGGWAGGAFGSKDHPAYSAGLTFDAQGNLALTGLRTKHTGDTETANMLNPQVAALNEIVRRGGLGISNLDQFMVNSDEGIGGIQGELRFLNFTSSNDNIRKALASSELSTLEDLASRIDYVLQTFDPLTTEALPAFTQAIKALNTQYDAAIPRARELGLSEDALNAMRQKSIDTLTEVRNREVSAFGGGLDARWAAATGNAGAAALISFDIQARQELDTAREFLKQRGVDAAQIEAYITTLMKVHGQERINLQKQFGEDSTALTQESLNAQLRAMQILKQQASILAGFLNADALGSPLVSPAERLAEAQRQFGGAVEAARNAGPGRADLGAVVNAGQALLAAGGEMYATGPQAATLRQMVRSSITSLGAQLDLPGFSSNIESGIQRAMVPLQNSLDSLATQVNELREELRTTRLLAA